MIIPGTEHSDMEMLRLQGWELRTPLNFPITDLDAPEIFHDLRSAVPEEVIPGDIVFIWATREQYIDKLTHQNLLDESLREYSEIWRILAEK